MLLGVLFSAPCMGAARPNVLLIITDDQGWGDISRNGNPHLRTPHIDRIAAEGASVQRFYVSPVCSPTRSSLLTGRWNFRTGVTDTYIGRSMMHADETTIAEALKSAGYRTGVFGKWHLGDCYPMRPQDQGFEESLVIRGGGIGQPSDPPGGDSYMDPVLQHNGRQVRSSGYCSDVFADAAIRWMGRKSSRPFFALAAFNAPHDPLQVPDAWVKPYAHLPQQVAKVYAMVKNIDDNIGRMLAHLRTSGQERDTIVVFLCDNGPAHPGYNGVFRGRKGTVYEGGIRSPLFVRWPGRIRAGTSVDGPAAHIDVMPTLLDACGVKVQRSRRMDGMSLLAQLCGSPEALPMRSIVLQWHRGDVPQFGRACTLIEGNWKIVQAGGSAEGAWKEPLRWSLYNIREDPAEEHDLAAVHPQMVQQLAEKYRLWFGSVRDERLFEPPLIVLDTRRQPETVLTRQDWRGPNAGWKEGDRGHWELQVPYRQVLDVRVTPISPGGDVTLRVGDRSFTRRAAAGSSEVVFRSVVFDFGRIDVSAGTAAGGARYVELARRLP
jgi:arylsulfatase A-like enzyme